MALFSIQWVTHTVDGGLCSLCSCKDDIYTTLREEMEVNIDFEIGDTVPIVLSFLRYNEPMVISDKLS